MRTAKAALALLVSASLAAPVSAQEMSAAVSAAGRVSALPRIELAAPLTPVAPLTTAPIGLLSAAPSVFAAPSLNPGIAAVQAAPAAAALPATTALPAASLLVSPAAQPAPIFAEAAATPTLAAAPAPSAAKPGEAASPAAAASVRARWENFWSGSGVRSADSPVVSAEPAERSSAPLSRASSRPTTAARFAAAAAVLTPAAHGAHHFLTHAVPYLEAGGLLAATYGVNRGVHAWLNRFAEKKGMDRHQVAAIRLVTSVALWTGAAAGALMLGGASHQTMAAVFGAGGTILTLGLRDVLGNVIQGVNFLVSRPFTIGERVQIDDQTGTISDATLAMMVVKKDDGTEVKIRHAALAAKPVIVFGDYQPKRALRLAVPARPKFQGALSAVVKSLDRRFWIAGAAFAALLAVPPFVPFLAAGWAATALHYALAASMLWLTRRVDVALTAAVNHLAAANGWRPETKVITRLGVSMALWVLGGGMALRALGVSWTALGAGAGITTLGLGLASNNFFGSVLQGGEILFSKPFKIGDRVKIGAFEGIVEDMTFNHVVLKLDEGRHALVPYAVVRDATLVVTPVK